MEENSINVLNKIIEQNRIDFIYPSDEVINIKLMENRDQILAKIISSPLKTLLITASDSRLCNIFNDKISISKLKTKELDVNEYIVGCISDRERGLIFCGGIEKVKIPSGNSYKIKLIINDNFDEFTEKILKEINIYGAWSYYIKVNKDMDYKLEKITPRVDLNMDFFRIFGINFPLLSII